MHWYYDIDHMFRERVKTKIICFVIHKATEPFLGLGKMSMFKGLNRAWWQAGYCVKKLHYHYLKSFIYVLDDTFHYTLRRQNIFGSRQDACKLIPAKWVRILNLL